MNEAHQSQGGKRDDVMTLITLLVSILVSFTPAANVSADVTAASPVIINEIMCNPDGDENAREFVELFNRSGEAVSLEGFVIGDGEGFDAIVPYDASGWEIPAGGFAVVFDPDYFDSGELYATLPQSSPLFTIGDKAIGSRGLSNSTAETVSLVTATGDTLSQVTYDISCPPGHSWERIDPEDDTGRFAPSRNIDGTPGAVNSVYPQTVNPALDATLAAFSPLQPVIGGDAELRVRYRNDGSETLEGVTVTLTMLPGHFIGSAVFDATLQGTASSENIITVDNLPGGRLAFLLTLDYNGVVYDSLAIPLDVPIPKGSLVLNEIMAAPSGGASEWVEIFNTGEAPVDIFHFGIRDAGAAAAATTGIHAFVPPGGYAILGGGTVAGIPGDAVFALIEHFPPLNNDGDSVVLTDFTGAACDSVRYTETTGGFSIERTGVSGIWDTSADRTGATPGRANSIAFDSEERKNDITLDIDPNPVGDQTRISYRLPFPTARVNLTLYDRRGRHIETIRDAEESGSEWSMTWRAVCGGSRLPAGPYILYLEALDKKTGRLLTERKPLVVGADL